MNEISRLKRKIDYLENTLACMRGENSALKEKLFQYLNRPDNLEMPPLSCLECDKKEYCSSHCIRVYSTLCKINYRRRRLQITRQSTEAQKG